MGRGGRDVARERGQPKKGGVGRDPRQRYPVNTQSGACLTPPPILTLLVGGPKVGGAGRGLGRAGGGEEEEGAGGQ